MEDPQEGIPLEKPARTRKIRERLQVGAGQRQETARMLLRVVLLKTGNWTGIISQPPSYKTQNKFRS